MFDVENYVNGKQEGYFYTVYKDGKVLEGEAKNGIYEGLHASYYADGGI